jgi:transcriptional regulator with XRE-family HTH domain
MSEPADDIAVQIGRRLRDRRLELGLSQVDLARRLGVTYQQVQKYERGANRIAADRLHDLARILDVPIAYFYGGAGVPPGLAEAADGFTFESATETDRASDEEAILLDAFRRIRDGRVRRRLVALVEAVAGPGPRDLGGHG